MTIKEGIVIQGQSGQLIAACAGPVDHPASLRPIPREDYPQLWNSIIHLLRNSGGLTYKRQYQKKQQKTLFKNMAYWALPFFYEVMATTTRKTLHIGLTPEPNPDAGIPAPMPVFVADLIIKATLLLGCGIYWCHTQSPRSRFYNAGASALLLNTLLTGAWLAGISHLYDPNDASQAHRSGFYPELTVAGLLLNYISATLVHRQRQQAIKQSKSSEQYYLLSDSNMPSAVPIYVPPTDQGQKTMRQ